MALTKVNATNIIDGILPVANGGTGLTTLGTAGQVLTVNGGATALQYSTPATTSPGGSTTQVQYNNAGAFGGSANFVFDGTNVGIGTSSPLGKLVVSNGSNNNFEVFMTGPAGGVASHLLSYNRAGSAYTDMHSSALNLIYNTNATERMRITSAGGVSFGSSGTAYGTTGQVLTSNGNAAPTWGSAIVSGTAVASTSGTNFDYTAIPSWVKRITVMFSGVSGNGSSNILIQLGTGSTTYTTSGYNSTSTWGNATVTSATTGLVILNDSASYTFSGQMVITNITGNTWVQSHQGKSSTGALAAGGGDIALGAALTAVRITRVNGTDTFDAGTINILYE